MTIRKLLWVNANGEYVETNTSDDISVNSVTTQATGVIIGTQAVNQSAALAVFSGSADASTYHNHDGRYYTQTQHQSVGGAGAANLPVLASASGFVANSFIPTAALLDGSRAFTGQQTFNAGISLNSQRIQNVADPISSADAATKNYVDARVQGLEIKDAVRLASSGANVAGTFVAGDGTATADTLTTAAASLSIDGVTVANGNIVLLKDQSAPAQNGFYSVTGVGTAVVLTRAKGTIPAADAWNPASLYDGAFAFVEQGTTNQGTGWVLNSGSLTPSTSFATWETTAKPFAQFSRAGVLSFAAPLSLSGTAVSLNYDSSLTVASNNLSIALAASNSGLSKSAGLAVLAGNGISVGSSVAVALASVSGLQFTGSALDTLLDSVSAIGASTLSKSANGLKVADASLKDAQIATNAAIAGTKVSPNFGSQNVSTTGSLSSASAQVTGLASGVVHSDPSGNLSSSAIVNADVSGTAAIAYSKLALAASIRPVDFNPAGTSAGQVLIAQSSTTAPAWTTLGGDASLAADGTVTISGAASVFTVGAVAINKGDLVVISAADTVLSLDITTSADSIGVAETAQTTGQTVRIKRNGTISGVVTGAAAGTRMYYVAPATISATQPSVAGTRVWLYGIARNSTDLELDIRMLKVNS